MVDLAKLPLMHPGQEAEASEPVYGLRALARANETRAALEYVLKKGYTHWVITFSGGKDSTASVVASLETALEMEDGPRRIDVVYADM